VRGHASRAEVRFGTKAGLLCPDATCCVVGKRRRVAALQTRVRGSYSLDDKRDKPGVKKISFSLLTRNYYSGSITAVSMTKSRIHRLGDLQLRIMKVLWAAGEATVADVHKAVAGERGLAYTTVATMLRKMEARGLVQHRPEARSFVYRASVAEDDVSTGMADHLLDRLFEGSLADMVSHLLSTREVSRAELLKLERLIAERKKSA
jgi:predicted transcriptional regulator